MNKFFSKMAKKSTVWALVTAIVLAAAIVVCALFGFNKYATLKDSKTLTVSVNSYAYETYKEEIVEVCEDVIGRQNLSFTTYGEMSGDVCEIVFAVDKEGNLPQLKEALQTKFAALKAEGQMLEGAYVEVSASVEKAVSVLAKLYILRSVIACVAVCALAFAYVAIRRQDLVESVVVGLNVLLSMLLTAALVTLTRVCVTSSIAAIIPLSGLLSAVIVLLSMGKASAAKKENSELSTQECILSTIAWKECAWLFGAIAVTTLLVGIVGRTAAAWFAVSTFLALLASAFVSLFLAPAGHVFVKEWADKKPAKDAYVGAKKTSTKKKKGVAPVAEAAEETPAAKETEESVAEETAETTTEEVEETAAPETDVAEEPATEEVEDAQDAQA